MWNDDADQTLCFVTKTQMQKGLTTVRQSREELNFVNRFVEKTYMLTGLVYYSGQPFAIAQFSNA